MNTLPVLPQIQRALSVQMVVEMETQVALAIQEITDIEQLREWHAQSAALAAYLQGRELQAPMLGAQRRVEARIGQLLGAPKDHQGRRHELHYHGKEVLNGRQVHEFRTLSRGVGQLAEEDWRHSRRELLKLINERFPVARKTPVVIQKNGTVKKPRAQRVQEISRLAADGHRAAQISKEIGMGEQQVRKLARDAGLTLPDTAIGRPQKLDSKRIITETINGIDAYVSGLSMLDDCGYPNLSTVEYKELMQALARSINGLKKLRTRMENQNARPSASAA